MSDPTGVVTRVALCEFDFVNYVPLLSQAIIITGRVDCLILISIILKREQDLIQLLGNVSRHMNPRAIHERTVNKN